MGQGATPLGLGFTLHKLHTGSKESQNNPQGYGKETQGHSSITKLLDRSAALNAYILPGAVILIYHTLALGEKLEYSRVNNRKKGCWLINA